MTKEDIVVGGIYSSDWKTAVRVTRITAPTGYHRTGMVYWVYAFWDRVEPVPEMEYEDTMMRFAHWARVRLEEATPLVVEVEEGEVPLSSSKKAAE